MKPAAGVFLVVFLLACSSSSSSSSDALSHDGRGDAANDGRGDFSDARQGDSIDSALPQIDQLSLVVTKNGSRSFRIVPQEAMALLEVEVIEDTKLGTVAFFESGLINYAPAWKTTGADTFKVRYAQGSAKKEVTVDVAIVEPTLLGTDGEPFAGGCRDIAVGPDTALVASSKQATLFALTASGWQPTHELAIADIPDFGQAVGLDGNAAVITGRGTAKIYTIVDGELQPALEIDAPDDGNRQFGNRAAISGDWVIVSDPQYGEPMNIPGYSDDYADRLGAVYVYRRQQGSWSFAQKLVQDASPMIAQADEFGYAIDIDGDQLIVGSLMAKAFFFELDGSNSWKSRKVVEALDIHKDAYTGAGFARSVAIEGSLAVVGAPTFSDSLSPLTTGAAFIFTDRSHTDTVFGAGDDPIGAQLAFDDGRLVRTTSNSRTPEIPLSYLRDEAGNWRTSATPRAGVIKPTQIAANEGFFGFTNGKDAVVHVHQVVIGDKLLAVPRPPPSSGTPVPLTPASLSGNWRSSSFDWADKDCVHSSTTARIHATDDYLLLAAQDAICTHSNGVVKQGHQQALYFTHKAGTLFDGDQQVGTFTDAGIDLTTCSSSCTDLKISGTPDGRIKLSRIHRHPQNGTVGFEGSGTLVRTGDVVLNPAKLSFNKELYEIVKSGPIAGVPVGEIADKTISLYNRGDRPATILSAEIPANSHYLPEVVDAFSFVGGAYPGTEGTCGLSVPPLQSCKLHLQVAPTRATYHTVTLVITYEDADSPGQPMTTQTELKAAAYKSN